MVEFALVFILFLSMLMAMFDFAYIVWVRGTLHHATREGVRYAITGQLRPGMGHDDSIRQVVMENAPGLLAGPEAVTIEYYRPACNINCSTTANASGNIVVVGVNEYAVNTIGPLSGIGANGPLSFAVAAVDKMEPLPGAPPPRTLPPSP